MRFFLLREDFVEVTGEVTRNNRIEQNVRHTNFWHRMVMPLSSLRAMISQAKGTQSESAYHPIWEPHRGHTAMRQAYPGNHECSSNAYNQTTITKPI